MRVSVSTEYAPTIRRRTPFYVATTVFQVRNHKIWEILWCLQLRPRFAGAGPSGYTLPFLGAPVFRHADEVIHSVAVVVFAFNDKAGVCYVRRGGSV